MKLTIDQNQLAAALEQAAKATPSKAVTPVLQHVLFDASDNRLKLTATNLDVEMSNTVECTTDQNGAALIPVKMVLDVVKRMAKGKIVEIDATDSTATFKSGRTKISVQTLPVEDFPRMANDEYECTYDIPSHVLHDMFSKVKFAASTEETRYYLNGVYVHHEDGKLHTVATDGHRFAKWAVDHDATPPSVIVPSGTVALVTPPDGSIVMVSVSEAKIKFDADGWSMVSKVIDGTYPDYKRVIPDRHNTTVVADAKAMSAAAGRVETAMEGKSRGIKLSIDDQGIEFNGTSQQANAEDYVEADVDGPALEIGVNSKYMSGIMAHVEGDAMLRLLGDMDPIKIEDTNDPNWMAIVMPMRC